MEARVELRIDAEEKARWSRLAAAAGISLSHWVRLRCNDGAEPLEAGKANESVPLTKSAGHVIRQKLSSAETPTAPANSNKGKTCVHGVAVGHNCWKCGGKAKAE